MSRSPWISLAGKDERGTRQGLRAVGATGSDATLWSQCHPAEGQAHRAS